MTNEEANEAPALQLLPLHVVTDGGAKRSRGRPKKVERQPSRSDLEYAAEVARERLDHVRTDAVVRAVAGRKNATEVLQLVAAALAEEAAVLQHERMEVQKRGRDVGQLVSRRVAVLSTLASLETEIGRQVAGVLDLHSEAIQTLLKVWVDDVVKVASEVLSPEILDVLLTKLEVVVSDWEDRAEALLR